jgi:hypothetical protein
MMTRNSRLGTLPSFQASKQWADMLRRLFFSEELTEAIHENTMLLKLYRKVNKLRGPNQTAKPVWLVYVFFSMEHVLPQSNWHNSCCCPVAITVQKMFAISSVRGVTIFGCEFSKPHSWPSARLAEDAPLGEGGVDGWPLLWGTTPFCFSLWLESEFSSFSSDFELRNRPPAPLALFKACWCRDSCR